MDKPPFEYRMAILMFVGGCAGSTACGIKIFRLQMLVIFLKNQIKKLFYPNSIIINKYNNQKISDEFINSVIVFIFSFLFIWTYKKRLKILKLYK